MINIKVGKIIDDIFVLILSNIFIDQPLYKEHAKVMWRAFRDIIHKNVPESRDKTWNSINRRGRYMKKFYKHTLIIYKTCKRELEQNKVYF